MDFLYIFHSSRLKLSCNCLNVYSFSFIRSKTKEVILGCSGKVGTITVRFTLLNLKVIGSAHKKACFCYDTQ